jgi:predicted esterase
LLHAGTNSLGSGRAGAFYVPQTLSTEKPNPLIVMLHGAGGSASDVLPMVKPFADRNSIIVLATDSRGATWDLIQRGFGPDVAFLDEALADLFRLCAVDPEHIAIAGFSDGASYALSLGLRNAGLFKHVLAFSPGFIVPSRSKDAPNIFISHGRQDQVLPIERCGRPVAAELKQAGCNVDFREFSGGHVVPNEMLTAAIRRFLA